MNATASLLADTICRTVELGVSITDAAVEAELTHLFCAPVTVDPVCAECGVAGRLRDHVERRVTDLPIVGHPTRLHVRVPRFSCENTACETRIFQQRMPALAQPRAKTTRCCSRWILQRLAIDRTSVSAVAKALSLGWDLVNDLALSKIRTMVYDQPGHFDGVRVRGVDEHKGKPVRCDGSSSFVTVLVDLTPVVDGAGPSRLLDMVPGRSAKVLTEWLDARDQVFRDRVKVVTMDGFAGYHTAAAKAVPEARTVMDPFHVVHLAADKLTVCRQRIQQATTGHRGRSGDPLYGIRRTLRTRAELLTDKQKVRLFKAMGEVFWHEKEDLDRAVDSYLNAIDLDEDDVVEAVRDACLLVLKQPNVSEVERLNGLAAATIAAIWAGAPFSAGDVADSHPFIRELIGSGDEALNEAAAELLESVEADEDVEAFTEALS